MNELGRFIIISGIILIIFGFFITFGSKIPFLGKLPGDIYIKKDGFSFYFPLATSIILSIIISLIFYFLNRR